MKLIVNWTKSKTFRSNQFCWVSVARCTLFLHQDRAILLLCLTAEREFPHSSLGCVRLLSFQRINENSPSFVTSEQRHKLEEIKFQQWQKHIYCQCGSKLFCLLQGQLQARQSWNLKCFVSIQINITQEFSWVNGYLLNGLKWKTQGVLSWQMQRDLLAVNCQSLKVAKGSNNGWTIAEIVIAAASRKKAVSKWKEVKFTQNPDWGCTMPNAHSTLHIAKKSSSVSWGRTVLLYVSSRFFIDEKGMSGKSIHYTFVCVKNFYWSIISKCVEIVRDEAQLWVKF